MTLNFILAKLFQFITFVLFTFMVLVYVGALALLPLDILTQVIRLLMTLGFPMIVAAAGGIGAVGYLGYAVYGMPELYKLIVEIGRDLIGFSCSQVKRFDTLIEATKGNAGQPTA